MWIYGERLRALRAERGLSLREVEQRGGPNKDTLSQAERGVHKPNARTLGRIARAFEMSATEMQAALEESRPKVPGIPHTPLASLSPNELEVLLFGVPSEEGAETPLAPLKSAQEIQDLFQEVRDERDALEDWLETYYTAPSSERFRVRADRERAEELVERARLYYLVLFDASSKITNPRGVPFKGVRQIARERNEATAILLEKVRSDAERKRLEESGEAG